METSKNCFWAFLPARSTEVRVTNDELVIGKSPHWLTLSRAGGPTTSFMAISINPHCTLHANTCKTIEDYVHRMVSSQHPVWARVYLCWQLERQTVMTLLDTAWLRHSWSWLRSRGLRPKSPGKRALQPWPPGCTAFSLCVPLLYTLFDTFPKTKPPLHKWSGWGFQTHEQTWCTSEGQGV